MHVLGIDPSLRNTGLVVAKVPLDNPAGFTIEHMELLKTDNQSGKSVRKSSDDLRCATEIISAYRRLKERFGFSVAFGEVPTGGQSARAAMSFGIAIGCLAALSLDVPLIQVNPFEVKLASFGEKYASKEEMIEWAVGAHPGASWLTSPRSNKMEVMVGSRFATADNEHLADATAAICAGIRTEMFRGMMAIHRVKT